MFVVSFRLRRSVHVVAGLSHLHMVRRSQIPVVPLGLAQLSQNLLDIDAFVTGFVTEATSLHFGEQHF